MAINDCLVPHGPGKLLCSLCHSTIQATPYSQNRHLATPKHQRALAHKTRHTASIVAEVVDDFVNIQDNDDVLNDSEPQFDFNFVDEDHVTPLPLRQPSNDWWPYDSETMYYCCLMFYNGKISISKQQRKHMWSILRDRMHLKLPSLAEIERAHELACTHLGNPPREHISPLGNRYHANDIMDIVCREVANPFVMQQLTTLPEDTGVMVSEMYNASKWVGDSMIQTPMIQIDGFGDVWIGDVMRSAQPDDRTSTVVVKKIHVKYGKVLVTIMRFEEGGDEQAEHDVPATLQAFQRYTLVDSQCDDRTRSIRVKCQNRRVVTVPVILQCDDMSGSVSKMWNKHMSWLMQLAGLDFDQRTQEYNMLFLATAKFAGGIEMGHGILKSFLSGRIGDFSYDPIVGEEVFVVPIIFALLGDNPMQADMCSTMPSGQANFPCRMCAIAGKISDFDKFKQYITPDSLAFRKKEDTKNCLMKQIVLISEQSISQVSKLQKDTGIKCSYSMQFAAAVGKDPPCQNSKFFIT